MTSSVNWSIPSDDIRLMEIDQPAANIRYVGRSSSIRGLYTDAIWQIRREYKVGTGVTITFANMGSETAVWTDRESYFPTAVPDDNNPLDPSTGSGSGGGGGGITATVPINSHIVLNKLIQGADSKITSQIGSKFAIIQNVATMQQLNLQPNGVLIFEA